MTEIARAVLQRDQLLTPDERSTRWGKSLSTFANMRSACTGPNSIKLGKTIRYRLSDVITHELAHLQVGDTE